ncbi:NAD(P)/FAD-dependent oxidoreductase [Algoriphagus sediminis]|uniref:FAD-dependent oxidoreductase n=1 Tax=Algoriphagus sediminis TaxID=3057113 RepID=A0ABT7Y9G3_9BACT|nr:FAD-dependent oxidoreductase [Algoriphagus sediminis]MDN3202844.1 FAD-dependent oxidoreductase [Algoriphagus sediminis]
MKVDFLLIGQGLAGSILAYRLIKKGKKVRVFDTPKKNLSSRVAAGLYNPITGRKMLKTWRADDLFPEIEQFYSELETETKTSFLERTAIYRPFLTIEEQNEWMGKSAELNFQPYVEKVLKKSLNSSINDPFGGILLKNCGWLDTKKFLDAMSCWLGDQLIQDEFEESNLQRIEDGWKYENFESSALIYCNGIGAMNSSFFSYLPFAPSKGEILEVRQGYDPNLIINRGVFRVGLGEGKFRVGSTYTHHDLEKGPTEKSKNELIRRLGDLMNEPLVEIIGHKHGIRPATRDRKPFLGKHPKEEGVYSFNGFGAKGVSLIPYFSKIMIDYIIENKRLDKEIDIERYFNYI